MAAFRPCLETNEPLPALEQLQRFRILCAVRHSPFGVENLNAIAEEILADAGLITPRHGWYRGQPITITQNDYNLGLFNGDSGIILPDRESWRRTACLFRFRRRQVAPFPSHPACRSTRPRSP